MSHVDEILNRVRARVKVRVIKDFSIPRADVQLLHQVIMDKLRQLCSILASTAEVKPFKKK